MKSTRSAFTLIELMVVIVVIGILGGLLLPELNRVQEKGRGTQCASNLRQIGAAVIAFAGDNNGLCPLSPTGAVTYTTATAATGPAWTEQLTPYIGPDRSVYVCPSGSRLSVNSGTYSYFLGCRAGYLSNNNTAAALRMNLLTVPSKYILGGDISTPTMYAATDANKNDYTLAPPFNTSPAAFHYGLMNLLFADGHVAAYSAFNSAAMNTHYEFNPLDGTGYNYGQ